MDQAGGRQLRWDAQPARRPLAEGIKAKNEVRSQFHHVIDVAPTVLEACGLPEPKPVNGVVQRPIEGVSLVYTFADAKAKDRRTTQYFEIFCNRAIYHDLEGAAQLHVEGGYGPVGVIADLTYLDVQPADGLVTADSRSTLFELLGLYRVVGTGGRQAGAVTFDLLAGARYYRFRNSIGGNVAGLLSAERTGDWIDPVVGARAGAQVTDALGLFVRGDAGGFGIGQSSDRACNVLAGFEYRCCECASLVGGYRWLRIDRESGIGRDRFLLDVTMAGPFVALAVRY